jgi:hypothetical protein
MCQVQFDIRNKKATHPFLLTKPIHLISHASSIPNLPTPSHLCHRLCSRVLLYIFFLLLTTKHLSIFKVEIYMCTSFVYEWEASWKGTIGMLVWSPPVGPKANRALDRSLVGGAQPNRWLVAPLSRSAINWRWGPRLDSRGWWRPPVPTVLNPSPIERGAAAAGSPLLVGTALHQRSSWHCTAPTSCIYTDELLLYFPNPMVNPSLFSLGLITSTPSSHFVN